MKLIEADKVAHEIDQLSHAWEYGRAVEECYEIVKSAQTVEAIPIAWILDYKDKYTVITSEECDPVKAEVIVDMIAEWVEAEVDE